MDLALFLRVLWRFKILVGLGVVIAALLAGFSMVRIDVAKHTLSYRSSEQWISYSRIFVTQRGFPYGQVQTNASSSAAPLSANAVLYASFAQSDAVRLRALRGLPASETAVQVAPVLALGNTGDVLPIISIAGTASTPKLAMLVARRETNALIGYVKQQQMAAGIPDSNRVVLQVIVHPVGAQLLKGRSKTLPIVVFVGIMLAVIGLVLVLENLRPHRKRLAPVTAQREAERERLAAP